MRGMELHHHLVMAEFAGTGVTRGTLVSLGRYAGLVEGEGRVAGELYRFDDLPAGLDVLDDVEDFNPTDPESSPYVRVARLVEVDSARTVAAWVYLYNGDVAGAPVVQSGDWRAHVASQHRVRE